MLKKFYLPFIAGTALLIASCNDSTAPIIEPQTGTEVKATGQSAIQDDQSAKNVVQVAMSSKDHGTLVTAVKAADLVDALSNAGPFTVFAPTNEAFNLLPAGTVDALLKPEKKADLVDLLQYHVAVGVFKADSFQDGQTIGEVNGDNIKITKKDGKIMINGTATIIASIPASNGIIHVIDRVLTAPAK
jgi:uncharacterized surface protein with fasciclin (FAS1) repeats